MWRAPRTRSERPRHVKSAEKFGAARSIIIMNATVDSSGGIPTDKLPLKKHTQNLKRKKEKKKSNNGGPEI